MQSHGHDVPPDIVAQLSVAANAFAEHFGRRPTLAACAPGRVNLIGEHTELQSGIRASDGD